MIIGLNVLWTYNLTIKVYVYTLFTYKHTFNYMFLYMYTYMYNFCFIPHYTPDFSCCKLNQNNNHKLPKPNCCTQPIHSLLLFHPYHVQQSLIVPEGSNHAHHWHSEHHQAQQDEHHSRSKEKALQGSILLPFHFSIHPHTQYTKTHQLGGDREKEGSWDENLDDLQVKEQIVSSFLNYCIFLPVYFFGMR